jgi:hypothetical protein
MRKMFFMCTSCTQRGVQRQWLVDHMNCRCIFLPVLESTNESV